MIYFITSNEDKFNQAKFIADKFNVELNKITIQIEEIQDLDPYKVVSNKLEKVSAYNYLSNKDFLIEDTSLFLECFDYKFPATLAKQMHEALGQEGFINLAEKYNKFGAIAKTIIGANINGIKTYHAGEIKGTLKRNINYSGHGFDDIFIPDGRIIPFSNLSFEENALTNMRGIAFDNFFTFLKGNK